MKTYEINTDKGVQTVTGNTKQEAIASLQSSGFAYAPQTALSSPPTPIPAAQLANPIAPLAVPPVQPSTTAGALTGAADASLDSFNAVSARVSADVDARRQAADASTESLEATMQRILGVQASRGAVEDSLNVDELGQMNNDAFTALQASKRAQQVEVQQAIDAAGGLQEGAAQTVQQINRRYAFEQADLAIALDVSNRNYLAAQQTADKKIQMQLEPLQTLLQFQSLFYEQNQSRLTKAEDNQLQLLIQDNTRKYEEQRESLKTLSDTKLQLMQLAQGNNAPPATLNAIQAAQTPEAAIAAAGQYGTDMLGRQVKLSALATDALQRANIQSQIEERNRVSTADPADAMAYAMAYKNGQIPLTQVPKEYRAQVLAEAQATGKQTLLGLLGQYRNRLDGLNWFTANFPQNKTLLDTLRGQITAEYKQQEKLGTLDLGVQRLIESIIPDPTKLSISSLDNSAQVAAIDNFITNQGGGDAATPSTKVINGKTYKKVSGGWEEI